MAIRYPILLLILSVGSILYLIDWKKKKEKPKESPKIANTLFVKNTIYYQKLLKDYKKYKRILYISFIIALISSIILVSRIQKIETHNINDYKRDIILCMDVSASVDQLNISMINSLKKTVESLEGERFGISIFNTTSIMISPLTDDYEFILDSLDEIQKSIKANNSLSGYLNNDYYIKNYINMGTIEGHEKRGSSLIGDGLASCVYSFPKQKEDRTRIIIFTTDNSVAGKPLLTLEQAAEISRKRKVIVYGIGTARMDIQDRDEMQAAVEETGGVFYEHSGKATKEIVQDIEKTSKSLIDSGKETTETDLPKIPLILFIISLGSIIICSKKVMS